jgi:hypothetical protein
VGQEVIKVIALMPWLAVEETSLIILELQDQQLTAKQVVILLVEVQIPLL